MSLEMRLLRFLVEMELKFVAEIRFLAMAL